MKVFLTGGTGFIGQPLARSLLAHGWDVAALVRSSDSPAARGLTRLGARCIQGDVTDRESLRDGMAGADVVVHNAGWYEVGLANGARARMRSINVTGTDNVLGMSLALGIARTVYVSSTIYFGGTGRVPRNESYKRQQPYTSFYERTKSEAHETALAYQQRGLPLIVVCPANVVGPNDHSPYGYFQRLHVNRIMPPFAWGPDTVQSPAHVDDVAAGIALAAEKGRIGETYILAGECTTMRQLLRIWGTQPGGPRVRLFLPSTIAALLFAMAEPIQRLLGMPAFISRETVNSIRASNAFSSDKAQRELGWTRRPAREMWSAIFDEERRLLSARKKRDLVSRLKPVETAEVS